MKRKLKIEISGEIAKNNSLPVDYFISIAKNLQDLIAQIVKYDIPSQEDLDLKNFKLELTGFEKGSAIPIFQYYDDGQENLMTPIEKQREIVDNKLDELLIISSENNYLKLLDKYPEPIKRNAIAGQLYSFVNSLKGEKTKIYLNDEKGYNIEKFNDEIKKILLIKVIEDKVSDSPETQLAKVKIYKGKKRKIIEMYDKKFNNIEYATEMIRTENYYYELKYPLRCKAEKEEGMITIENEILGIFAYGETVTEAEIMFNKDFDFIFKRYNELNDEKLTEDVKMIKMNLNNLVKEHGEFKS